MCRNSTTTIESPAPLLTYRILLETYRVLLTGCLRLAKFDLMVVFMY